ncbi:unnamed protein product [Oppiella nova]|uniref:Major facilitator superfamily (MFS) profile domain-containing protein n=1 Tax=Oppiella nova TaxID=334625 RepID=A0A7R9LMW5_9ACAR|nr:unnamed protein product [Oppiella nova]CAG2164537.1 unnamed protein product [Oppiella nova]
MDSCVLQYQNILCEHCLGPVAGGLTTTYGCRTGLGLLYLPQVMIVTYWFDKRLSLATGIGVCGTGIGIAIFALLSDHLIETYGWKGAMLLLSGLMFSCIAFSSLFRKVDYMEEKSHLKTALTETFDFHILTDVVFTGMGTGGDAVNLMVFFGLSNAFGRAFFGYIADFPSLNRIILYGLSVLSYGVAIGLIAAFGQNYTLLLFPGTDWDTQKPLSTLLTQ